MISENAAMAITVVVENMIEKHCPELAVNISNDYKELKSTLKKFKDYD